MSKNVVDFPGSSQTAERQALEQERRRKDEEHAQRTERRRLKTIQSKMATERMMHRISDRITVGKNLWRILSRLEAEHSISKKDVLHRAGHGRGTDSTKRLPCFAIDPSWSEAKQNDRGERLTKHIDRYARIASTAATLCGKEETAFLLDLVEGSRYAGATDEDADEDSVALESWSDIRSAINVAEKAISAKHDLRDYFDDVRNYQITDSYRGLVSEAGRAETYLSLEKKSWPGTFCSESLPPRPQIDLGAVRVCRDIPCTIFLKPCSGFDEADRLLDSLIEAGLRTTSLVGMATPVLKIWLDILPTAIPVRGTLPVLRMEPVTYLRSMENFSDYTSFGGRAVKKGDRIGLIKGSLEAGENDAEQDDDNEVYAAFRDESGDEAAVWVSTSITAEFDTELSDYFDTRHAQISRLDSYIAPFNDEARSLLYKECHSLKFGPHSRYCTATASAMAGIKPGRLGGENITAFGSRTMAAALERSLLDAPDGAMLTHLLDVAAGEAKARLAAAITGVRNRRQKRFAEILVKHAAKDPSAE